MFTGIIETIGKVAKIEEHGDDWRLLISAPRLDLTDTKAGDSIAVNGVCLSVIDIAGSEFIVDVSAETLSFTTISDFKTGSHVNLERALRLSDRLHGHLVSGHIDGTGSVMERYPSGRSEQYIIEAPDRLMQYICPKGSISVDGVSLTVNNVDNNRFSVNIIPHTLEVTLFHTYETGNRVNLEVDIVARYLDSLSQSPA
ncbi:MAG TPA: riboflavin synthase [Gammaproteobacteria bacterium]|nr:riboflavin synthase [Gammaproteobacteria bacterium]